MKERLLAICLMFCILNQATILSARGIETDDVNNIEQNQTANNEIEQDRIETVQENLPNTEDNIDKVEQYPNQDSDKTEIEEDKKQPNIESGNGIDNIQQENQQTTPELKPSDNNNENLKEEINKQSKEDNLTDNSEKQNNIVDLTETIENIPEYCENISRNLIFYPNTGVEKEDKQTELFNDGDFQTSESVNTFSIWLKEQINNGTFFINNMKIYCDKTSENEEALNNVEIKVGIREKKTDAMIDGNVISPSDIIWGNDQNGTYAFIKFPQEILTWRMQVKFPRERNVDIKEVELLGKNFEQNLFYGATLLVDNAEQDMKYIFDNVIMTPFTQYNALEEKEFIIEAPKGYEYILSHIYFAANFPSDQGIKSIDVSYWDGEKWLECVQKMKPEYTSSDQRRETTVVKLGNDTPITTTKLRMNISLNGTWENKGIIAEMGGIGTKQLSAQSIANVIDHANPIALGNSKIEFSWVNSILKNASDIFEYSIKSSDESIIDKDGYITFSNEPKMVSIRVLVKNTKNGDSALSREFDIKIPAKPKSGMNGVNAVVDYQTAYQNPASGWVLYFEGFECEVHDEWGNGVITTPHAFNKGLCMQVDSKEDAQKWWDEVDKLIDNGLQIGVLYIREPWSWFEPNDGEYAWRDENSVAYALVKGAKERNIQLAFRILTATSSCKQQATPEWVFEKGAEKVSDRGSYNLSQYGNELETREPYLDNPIFIEYYDRLVSELSKDFNNEHTAFIDAHGHGEWGEMNAKMYSKNGNLNETVKTLQDVWIKYFPDVLLGGQFGSNIGNGTIQSSFEQGEGKPNFVIRRDAFGSKIWLRNTGHFEKIKRLREENGIPVFAENCYHHLDSRDFRWSKIIFNEPSANSNEYGGDDPFTQQKDTVKQVITDAIEIGANTLDLRVLEDARILWGRYPDEVQRFNIKGGYRLSIIDGTYPETVKAGEMMEISSTWQNTGSGIVPNKNLRWNNKFLISYALIDNSGNIVHRMDLPADIMNIGDFENGNTYSNTYAFEIPQNIPSGNYKIGVGIVNKKDDYNVGIKLANVGKIISSGWLEIGSIDITNDNQSNISQDIEKLKLLIDEAKTLNPNKYTTSSFERVKNAIKYAESIILKGNDAQKEEIIKATDDLKNAINMLQEISPDDDDYSSDSSNSSSSSNTGNSSLNTSHTVSNNNNKNEISQNQNDIQVVDFKDVIVLDNDKTINIKTSDSSIITVTSKRENNGYKIDVDQSKNTSGNYAFKVALQSQNDNMGTVAIVVDKNGNEILQKACYVRDGKIILNLKETCFVKIENRSKSFNDVKNDDWYKDAVDFVTSRNLFSGVNDYSFSPNLPMNRGMLVTVLYRLAGEPDVSISDNVFNDVKVDEYYSNAVVWASKNNIVSGVNENTFSPNSNVTREQVAAILYRHSGLPEISENNNKFIDLYNVSDYALSAVNWAFQKGIITGKEENLFDPKGNATRAQVAKMLMNFVICE